MVKVSKFAFSACQVNYVEREHLHCLEQNQSCITLLNCHKLLKNLFVSNENFLGISMCTQCDGNTSYKKELKKC